MTDHREHLETLSEIRNLMERSSRFISLSGLSGIIAGFAALIGAGLAFNYLGKSPFAGNYMPIDTAWKKVIDPIPFVILVAGIVLLVSIVSSIFLTTKRAKEKGQKIWDNTTRRLLINLLIPLVTGGVYCLILLKNGAYWQIAPTTLIFYGLGLINASKYTLNDIRYLGFFEIALGIIAMLVPGFGLEFWTIGFGVLHIIYGTLMYLKYERTS